MSGSHDRTGTAAIDGLRGLAILLVLAYHTWLFSWLTPTLTLAGVRLPIDTFPRVGYLGVDLFFVISGFCLFFPEARALAGGPPPPRLGDFAYRRFIKIVPSYALALLATVAVAAAVVPGRELARAIAEHLLFVNNFTVDYLGQTNSVFWSLAVEAQFYVVFPLLAFAARRSFFATALAMVCAALAFRFGTAGCCLRVEVVSRQLPAYLDLFAFGMVAAYAYVRASALPSSARRRAFFTAGALALVATVALLMQSANGVQYDPGGRERWDVFGRSAFGAAVAGVALCSCLAAGWWQRAVGNPVLVFLSVISYNLYLWHTLFGIWMRDHRVPPSTLADVHADDAWKPWFVLCMWAASFAVSVAVTYFVERPLLGTVKPQPFSFDWARRFGLSAPPPRIAQPERRT